MGMTLSLFMLSLLIGVPVAFALGLGGLVYLTVTDAHPSSLASLLFSNLDTPTLASIPFFIFAAEILSRTGATRRLVDFVISLIGHHRGGLPVVAVVACAFFSAICGSSVATAAAIGVVLIPQMVEHGYERRFCVGLVATAGGLGILIPPSIPLIIYGLITDSSVATLFKAAMVPGLALAGLLSAIAYLYGSKTGAREIARASWTERAAAFKRAFGILLMPVVVLGGIYGGFFTPTEASAVSVIVALLLAVTVHRTPWRELATTLMESASTAAMILFILGCATLVGFALTAEQIPHKAFEFATELQVNATLLLIVLMGFFLVAGMFLEIISIILITMPILLPILNSLDVDLIYFAIILILNMELAVITPPIGLNLFVISAISKVPVLEVFRGAFPFVATLLLLLLAMILQPDAVIAVLYW